MVEAKSIANYIVEPLGSNINSPSSFIVRKRFQDVETTTTYTTSQVSTMFSDIMTECSRPTTSGSAMKGALIFLKNGTYAVDGTNGVSISDATDSPNVSCRLIGETRDNTIIKNGGSVTWALVKVLCSADIENITFNGNSVANVRGIYCDEGGTATKIVKVKNCRLTNIEHMDIQSYHNCFGLEVSHCIFDNHQTTEDQLAFECTGFADVHDNFFDKTNGAAGQENGSCITTGSAFNCNIHDNILKRVAGNITHGISIEAFSANPNYDMLSIHDNLILNGTIAFGSSGAYTTTFNRVSVEGNTLYGGDIRILGPDSGSDTTQIQNFNIENNRIYDPYYRGIYIEHTAGLMFVRNNTIKNSNVSLEASDTFDGGIVFHDTRDLICENNSIYMGTGAAHFSPYGIQYFGTNNNLTLRDNRIINRTANPSYISGGTLTGTPLISKSL